jgi:hypothetical protein
MNRPLTVLGAERRLFFTALIAGAGVFNLLDSLLGGFPICQMQVTNRVAPASDPRQTAVFREQMDQAGPPAALPTQSTRGTAAASLETKFGIFLYKRL